MRVYAHHALRYCTRTWLLIPHSRAPRTTTPPPTNINTPRRPTQCNATRFHSIQFAVTTNSTLSRPPPEARWYTRDELLAVLSHNEGTTLSRQEHKEIAASAENSNPHEKPDDANAQPTAAAAAASTAPAAAAAAATAPVNMNRGPPFKIPPRTAIGGVILSEWAHGRAGPQPVSSQTANL